MGPEFGDFTGGFLADVNCDPDDDGQSAHENKRNEPRGDMAHSQRLVKGGQTLHGRARVEKDFRNPRHHNQNENENVIAFQAAPDCLQFGDLERRQDEILAHEFFPFALQHLAVFHHHRNEKVGFEHANARTEGVIKTVTPCFDPEHAPDDCEIEKEDDVRHFAVRKSDCDNRRAARDRPVRRDVEALTPDHDTPEFPTVEVRHRIDVAWIIKTLLERDGRFFT